METTEERKTWARVVLLLTAVGCFVGSGVAVDYRVLHAADAMATAAAFLVFVAVII